MKGYIHLGVVLMLLTTGTAFPERGKWTLPYNNEGNSAFSVAKSMFNRTKVNIEMTSLCRSVSGDDYTVNWVMIRTACFQIKVGGCIDNSTGTLDMECGCTLGSDDGARVKTAIGLEFRVGSGIVNCDDYTYIPSEENSDEIMTQDAQSACQSVSISADVLPTKVEDTVADTEETDTAAADTTPSTKVTTAKIAVKDPAEGPGEEHGDGETERRKRDTAPQPLSQENKDNPTKTSPKENKDNTAETSQKENKDDTNKTPKDTPAKTTAKTQTVSPPDNTEVNITQSWDDGQYTVFVEIKPVISEKGAEKKTKFSRQVILTTRDSRSKLLSAADFPYLYFYLIMTIVYVLFGFFWLMMLACYWRDLLRIQYFIALVILLGLVEKIFYYSEWQHVDAEGYSTKTLVIVAELVSTVKKTLARALVIVVSVGFGLIKPRLGPTLHKLIAVCVIYFVLSAVECCLRVMKTEQTDKDNSDLIAVIPLALCETGIVYWVFSSLLQTIRTLRLRRNVAKLSLYRHFTNLLVFTILASIAYFIWEMKELRFVDCRADIRELWLENGFSPMLFCIVLLVIMILWRPSINNQRFSHSLLLDNEDGEDEEDTLMMSDAFDAKKRSQANGTKSARDKRKSREEKVEDDLQWIEDNIPASVADQALQPVMNDSEEEIMTQRFELSKMD